MKLNWFCKNEKLSLGLIVLGGLLLRLFLISNKGYYGDILPIIGWVHGVSKFGISWLFANYKEAMWFYPPFFSYLAVFLGRVFHPPVSLEIIKIPCIISDLFTALLFYYLFESGRKALLAAALWLFNPVTIILSAVWGQLDAIPALFLTAAFVFLAKKRLFLVGMLSALTVLTKLQFAIAVPAIFVIAYLREGFAKGTKAIIAFFITFLVLLLPLVFKGLLSAQIKIARYAIDLYPQVSLNAYNFWNAIFGGKGLEIPDAGLFLELITFKQLGILLFLAFYALAIWYLIKEKAKLSSAVLALLFIMMALYMFATQMHERYIHPTFIFLTAGFLLDKKLRLPFFILVVVATLNLLEVLVKTYPNFHPRIALFIDLNFNTITLLSIINLAVFAYLSCFLVKALRLR